ncbi:MAG: hypothetical protein CBC82_06990 [Cellvibrionales bacterium TMED122]|jgi:SAM-dependent methyltransferase|nr:MAG: hypothetical protein CBC82_06990 [Cellvibrionales bacterium TMED122]|tara:strand:- start:71 stop:1282 length:1212 start_codon:yes stop_codon:yes gene_type:complete
MALCRICKNKLIRIIKFRNISLVGNFYRKKKSLKKYKISLNFCKICKHVQISEIINPDLLFKNYLWETGVSKTNINLIKTFIEKLKKFKIKKNSKILEIASNDGSLLDIVKKKFNCFVLGIDPAKNLIKNKKKNFTTISDYFNYRSSVKIKKKFENFDLVIARNVVAHVKNPNEIFKGVENILKKTGQFVLEVPHFYNIFKLNQYDNVFHEHIGFHSLKSIIDLSQRSNLKVFNVEKIDSQGGSIRCYVCKKNSSQKISPKIKSILIEEAKLGLYSSSKLKLFKKKILSHISEMRSLIKFVKNQKKRISVYGASGKGQALMQYCNLNNKIIDYVFDKSKLKQNCFTPGTLIKIKSPKEIKKIKTHYLLILSWNIKDEIMKQENNFLKKGGKFIIPFPHPRVIN